MNGLNDSSVHPESAPVLPGVSIQAEEIINELTNRITQLTMDGILKDLVIRKLEEQLKVGNHG